MPHQFRILSSVCLLALAAMAGMGEAGQPQSGTAVSFAVSKPVRELSPVTGNRHLQTPPPPLREFNPLIPTQLEDVILRALAKEPGDRYKDMLAFAHAYRDALEAAASAQTDTNSQVRATEIIENAAVSKTVEQSEAHLNPEETVMRATLVVAPTDEATNEGGQSDKLAVRQLGQLVEACPGGACDSGGVGTASLSASSAMSQR